MNFKSHIQSSQKAGKAYVLMFCLLVLYVDMCLFSDHEICTTI